MTHASEVRVCTPARIHLGLLNLSDFGQRVDGGIGIMVQRPSLQITASPADRLEVTPSDLLSEVLDCARRLDTELRPLRMRISGDLPRHTGLGWHTQLKLGLATALASVHRIPLDPNRLSTQLGRGGTSAIGSLGYWRGGFLVDGGHRRSEKLTFAPSGTITDPLPAPLLFHSAFPWWVVIGRADGMSRVSGDVERQLFRTLTPVPVSETLHLYRIVLDGVIPAVVERDFHGFSESVEEMTAYGFKRREVDFRGDPGRIAMKALKEAGLGGVSMSSWGPSFVGFTQSLEAAMEAKQSLMRSGLFNDVWATCASEAGATVAQDGVVEPAWRTFFDEPDNV